MYRDPMNSSHVSVCASMWIRPTGSLEPSPLRIGSVTEWSPPIATVAAPAALKPEMNLSKKEELQVKKVAGELLETLKREKLVLDWRKRQQSRAAVQVCIEETLDHLPRVYTPELYEQKCDAVFQHVYESYYGQGNSVYGAAA